MGRGRAKAKQRKVARELKYGTYDPDLGALQSELSGGSSQAPESYDDPYAPADEGDDDAGHHYGGGNGRRS